MYSRVPRTGACIPGDASQYASPLQPPRKGQMGKTLGRSRKKNVPVLQLTISQVASWPVLHLSITTIVSSVLDLINRTTGAAATHLE